MSNSPKSLYVALHQIIEAVPGALVHTGEYRDDGEPIVRIKTRTTLPGQIFSPLDPSDAQRFVDDGAAAPVSEREGLIYDRL